MAPIFGTREQGLYFVRITDALSPASYLNCIESALSFCGDSLLTNMLERLWVPGRSCRLPLHAMKSIRH